MKKNKLMLGLWHFMIGIPPALWEKQILNTKMNFRSHLAFMSGEHRLIHHFVVRELPNAGKPLTPMYISSAVGLPVDQVNSIMNDLENHMTFLFRNKEGHVTWAYPVTVEITPHRVTFDTGEQLYAA